jgi:hypothetical protein
MQNKTVTTDSLTESKIDSAATPVAKASAANIAEFDGPGHGPTDIPPPLVVPRPSVAEVHYNRDLAVLDRMVQDLKVRKEQLDGVDGEQTKRDEKAARDAHEATRLNFKPAPPTDEAISHAKSEATKADKADAAKA